MKVYVEVYGCTANKSDACTIKKVLEENNHEIVNNVKNAEVVVVLTCTVINTTEQRMISRFKKLKNTGKKIVVSGCMATVQKKMVRSVIPNALFLPPRYIYQISELLTEEKIDFVEKSKTLFNSKYDSISAPILISEGCNFSCSYCITTLARGNLVSFPVKGIVRKVSDAISSRCREILLTAQDTGSYGLDINKDLGNLLKKVVEISGDYRVRVGMMNPATALKNLESILHAYDNPHIYKFVHLPVQSGDNLILKKMNRKYTVQDFKKIVRKFKDKYPDITVATDVIVGFPTETQEQFNKTVELLKNVKPDITNITRFSARPNTKAKIMKGRIKTEIVKSRSKILTDVCSDISYMQNNKHVGKTYSVLITEKGKNDTYVGRSENYKPVVCKEKVSIGSFYNMLITGFDTTYLVGSLI